MTVFQQRHTGKFMETIVRSDGSSPAKRRAGKKLRRKLIWLAILAVLLGGAYYFWSSRTRAANAGPENLETVDAFSTKLVETVSASGSVTAQTGAEVKIGSQITGTIKRLYADVGGHVQAGQVIAQLDLPDIEAQLAQAEAGLSQARTRLAQQESGVGMQVSQNSDTIRNSDAALRSSIARLDSAAASARMTPRQTQSDIARARAGLNTALAQQVQAEKSHDLEIGAATEAVNQASASNRNDAANLKREKSLLNQGYVAASDADTAQTRADVSAASVQSAQQNLELARAKADADVQTAREQVAEARASLTAAEAESYNDAMRRADVVSASASVGQAQAQLSSAHAGIAQNTLKRQDVAQARSAVDVAEAQVRYWHAQFAKTLIRTPISGTVLQLASQQGETLAAGLSTATIILVANLNRLQVDAFVDETDIGKVRLGQSATVTVDSYPDRKFVGRVSKIASGSTLQQNVVTYDVTIAIQDPQHLLKPEMTASVTIDVGEHPGAVVVPNEAIKPDASATVVYVKRPGAKTPDRQAVVTGPTDGTNTQIFSGVKTGDRVVLAGWPPPAGPGGMTMTAFGPRPGGGPEPKRGQKPRGSKAR
jgi:HlyD family secretion protein